MNPKTEIRMSEWQAAWDRLNPGKEKVTAVPEGGKSVAEISAEWKVDESWTYKQLGQMEKAGEVRRVLVHEPGKHPKAYFVPVK